MKGLFITGTDTDVGKTVVTGAIAAALRKRGYHIGVFKPLASGAVMDSDGILKAEDADFLMMSAKIDESLRSEVNEICLAPALTPAVAAKLSGISIDMGKIIKDLRENAKKYALVLVEGVGGITAPLWEAYLTVDLMSELGLPAVVVSHSGLGSINHTVLTYAYAQSRQVDLVGFIFNRYNEKNAGILESTNLDYIKKLTNMPLLGKMPQGEIKKMTSGELAEFAERYLDIDLILKIMEE